MKENPKYSELIRKLDMQKLVFQFGIGTKGELLNVTMVGGAYIDDSIEKLGRELLYSISPLSGPPNQLPIRTGIRLEIAKGPNYPALYSPPIAPRKPGALRFE